VGSGDGTCYTGRMKHLGRLLPLLPLTVVWATVALWQHVPHGITVDSSIPRRTTWTAYGTPQPGSSQGPLAVDAIVLTRQATYIQTHVDGHAALPWSVHPALVDDRGWRSDTTVRLNCHAAVHIRYTLGAITWQREQQAICVFTMPPLPARPRALTLRFQLRPLHPTSAGSTSVQTLRIPLRAI
jgi:hypothetical protein